MSVCCFAGTSFFDFLLFLPFAFGGLSGLLFSATFSVCLVFVVGFSGIGVSSSDSLTCTNSLCVTKIESTEFL